MDKSNAKKPIANELRVLTLRDMVAPLFRKKRIVLGTFLLIFCLATLMGWRWASHYYESSMQVVVGRERSEPTVTPQADVLQDSKVVTTDDVASEAALLQGRDMLSQAAQTCKLAEVRPSFWDRFDSRSPEVKKAAALEGAPLGITVNAVCSKTRKAAWLTSAKRLASRCLTFCVPTWPKN